jgi:DNA replication protein DnaC
MDAQAVALKALFNELNLKHIAHKVEEFLAFPENREKTNLQFMLDVLGTEASERRRIAVNKRLRHAGFPMFDKELELDLYDFGCRTGVTKRQLQELTSNFVWIDQAYNILLLGGSGLGKSFLACYVGNKAIEAGYKVMFISMNNLAHLLRTEGMLARSKYRLKRIRSCDLLILDEVGNAVLDRQDANRFFQLICDFYQQTSIILTSNKDFQEWTATLGDAVMTTAVLDRVLHKCEVFNIGGDSWRMSEQRTILNGLMKGGMKHAPRIRI